MMMLVVVVVVMLMQTTAAPCLSFQTMIYLRLQLRPLPNHHH
jgi:hypothetical protein